jgi:DNA mismatch repair protein MutS2
MAQAGIPIPAAEGSRLGVFREIMADIGDDQDIQTRQSTFSAHAGHLGYMVDHARRGSLAIIDEPGMGTDPDEGVALAMAVLDFLLQQSVFTAVSTHSNRLKAYGLLNKAVANASVEFDEERNCPTFKLTYGSPGISHALEMARSIGMPQEILARAKAYLDQDEVELNRLIEKLNRLIADAEREKRETEEARNQYRDALRETRDRLIRLESEKKALIEAKRVEAETAIGEAREELKQAINLLKNKEESVQAYVTERYAEVGGRLLNHFKAASRDGPFAVQEEIKEGQAVIHKKLKQKGVVQRVGPSAGLAQILLGKVRMSARIEDLEVLKGSQADSELTTPFT